MLRIFLIKLEGDISNAGRGVFPGRFCNNIFRGNIGQLVRYDADIFFRCNDIDIFFRNKMVISFKGLLYQGLSLFKISKTASENSYGSSTRNDFKFTPAMMATVMVLFIYKFNSLFSFLTAEGAET